MRKKIIFLYPYELLTELINPLVSLDVDKNVYMIYFDKEIHSNQVIWCLVQSNMFRLINNILSVINVFLKLYKK